VECESAVDFEERLEDGGVVAVLDDELEERDARPRVARVDDGRVAVGDEAERSEQLYGDARRVRELRNNCAELRQNCARRACFSECIIVTMSDESTANDGWSCHENCVPPLPYIDARRPLA
jgi:hypothetical protein